MEPPVLFFYKAIVEHEEVLDLDQRAHATYLVKVADRGGHVKCPVAGTSEEATM